MNKLLAPCLLALMAPGIGGAMDLDAEKRMLLDIHEGFKAAHIRSDPDAILELLATDYVRVNRGEVSRPSSGDMSEGMRSYLGSTRFTEYEDLRPPIVKVSADGTLGWVIVQLRARGVRTDEGGVEAPVEFVCAWISLFEKRKGRWVNTGDVSTFKQ